MFAGTAEARQFRLLLPKRLDDADAGQVVLQPGVDVAQPVAHPAVDGARALVEPPQAEGHDRQRDQRSQSQSPVERQQHQRRPHQL